MANNVAMSFHTAVSCINRRAFADNFIKVKIIGIIIGKLKIAINVALLLAFAEIAEIKVNVIEKPMLPKNNAVKNSTLFLTGFPATKLNTAKDKKDKKSNNPEL